VANVNDEVTKQALLKNYLTMLGNYYSQVIAGGFEGSLKGSVSINEADASVKSTGSNQNSLLITNHIDGTGIYDKANTNATAKKFTIDVKTIGSNAKIEVTIGGVTIKETYTKRDGDTLNEGSSFGASADNNIRAKNLAEPIVKSTSSQLRDMFDISVKDNSITFEPKTTLSNFQVKLNGYYASVLVTDIGAKNLNPIEMRPLEMRPLNKTSNKAMQVFGGTGFGNIGTTKATGELGASTTIILKNTQINGTDLSGNVIGVLGSIVVNAAIYNKLAAMPQTELSTIIKDLQTAWNGYFGGICGTSVNKQIDTIRNTIDGFGGISDLTKDFLKSNFFANNTDDGKAAGQDLADCNGSYCAVAADADPNTGDSCFANEIHNNTGAAQALIADINKLVTTVYFKKMLGANNGLISESARLEIADGAVISGGRLDARK